MDSKKLQIRNERPPIEQFWDLFETTGWNLFFQATCEEYARALANSWLVVSAYNGKRLVGVGRVVTDGAIHAMIYDLIVHPDYQRGGIGSQILGILIEKCKEAKIHDIQLFCAPGKRAFYEKRHFAARSE